MTEESFREALERAQRGEHDAFRVLFDRLHDRMFTYAVSHTGDRDRAMDIVQETFVDLWKQLPRFQYRSDDEFLGFVFLVLKRKLARHYAMSRREPYSLDERPESLGGEDSVLERSVEHEDHRWLLSCVDALSERSREVIVLRHWSGFSFAEIAKILGITETAARVRHHRATAELRVRMKSMGYE
jgi:RNA polymerase sigma-70 factor (ECF subfamily)